MADVILENVTKEYGDTQVLKNINLEIKDEEFLVLVGPSGCGKSTTLRIVAGLEILTQGKVYIGGRLVNGIPPKDRDICMVFQNYALYPHMDVYKNLSYGLSLRKFPRKEIDRRVQDAAGILGIGHLLHRKPAQLSGGERQRVAVGRAIVRKPQVFLFDEPLSNLDAKLRVQMRMEIKRLSQRLQTTMIYVTHDQVEAMTMGDRIVVMKDGFIQQIGTPAEVYHSPNNIFVAGFIGSPSMNFFPCILRRRKDRLYADMDSFEVPIPDEKAASLKKDAEKIIFGIRPEDIYYRTLFSMYGDFMKPEIVKGFVELIEPLGSEQLLSIKQGDHSLIAKIDARAKVAQNTEVEFIFDMSNIHLFDARTGNCIL
jgi:multiple sugar transport system ATP-binding protein